LHAAAEHQLLDIAELLLDAGAEVDALDDNGNTPLSNSVFSFRGNGEMITLLRRWGADPYKKNNYGVSPVELARQIANYNVSQFFSDLL